MGSNKGRAILNKIKGDLLSWKISGSHNTFEQDDPRRTFITNLDRKDQDRLLRYITVVKEFNLDYEIHADAYSTDNQLLSFLIGFYVKGPHQNERGPIINAMILANKHP